MTIEDKDAIDHFIESILEQSEALKLARSMPDWKAEMAAVFCLDWDRFEAPAGQPQFTQTRH